MASISWLIAFFCVLLRDDHARNILCCSGVSSTQSPSAKNCASVMPNPLQMLSSVGMEGVVFRLKILEMVDWESPDSNASRYSLHCRSAINYRMRSFAFIKIIHSSTKHCIVQLRCKIVGLCIDNITQMRYTIWEKNAIMGYKGATGRERKTILLRLLSENGHGQRRTF